MRDSPRAGRWPTDHRTLILVTTYPGQPSCAELEREAAAGERPRKDYVELARLVRGDGIYMEELRAELAERGLPVPRMTGIRHWFADYDPEEERRRLVQLLTGPA